MDMVKGDHLKDPRRVKPVKAAKGAPTTEDLDRYEVLLAVGGSIPPDELQRLIEAARTPPAPPAAPIHQQDTQRIPVQRRRYATRDEEAEERYRAPPRRKPKPIRSRSTIRYVGYPVDPEFDWHSIFMALIVMVLMWSFRAVLSDNMVVFLTLGPVVIWLAVSRRKVMRKLHAREVADERNDSSGTRPSDDDDEDDDEYRRYLDERWQGDNDLNGRNYSGRAI